MFKGRTIDHIGLASANVEEDVKFYTEVLGFRVAFNKGPCYFLTNGSTMYEIYPMRPDAPEELKGKIDHIAYTSRDIDADYKYAVEQGYTITTKGIEEIPVFWEHGIRYFKIASPGGEQIEFNMIL